ncbi:MAG: SRPBCC family protein [Burkholderiaceae bacterium]|nr:SRPBCC family protein [Burkholderiaceae bacterium]
MARIEFQVSIKAPIELVYQVSQDYSVRYDWDTFPENITLLNGAKQIEKGVCVSVTAKNGLQMEVEFVQVMPPTATAVTMTKGPLILKAFSGSWVFKSISATETNAKFVYSIKTKWWSIPFISEAIASRYFYKVIVSRLSGLKAYCETKAN